MLTQRVDLFDSTYGHFTHEALAAVRPAIAVIDGRHCNVASRL